VVPLKGWKSLDTWGKTLMNENSIEEENKSSLNQGMLAVIHCRIFVLQSAIQKYKQL
jgi:hypothetical protein